MGRGSYLARTSGGTSASQRRSYSDRQQSNYSSQQNNNTGQSNSGPGRSGSGYSTKVVSDGMTQQDIDQIKSQSKAANEAAYQASLAKQEELRKAIAFMNSQKSNESGQINLSNIDDKKLEEIAKTGLFAMEASGDLGGTFGAEIEANKLKYALANAQTNEEAAAIRATMEKMGYSNVSQYDPFTSEGESNPNYNPNLGYDPTGTLSFGDVESDPNLKFSYYGLQNKNASADQIRQFLPNVYGYKSSGLGSGGFGGGSGGYGYGSWRWRRRWRRLLLWHRWWITTDVSNEDK